METFKVCRSAGFDFWVFFFSHDASLNKSGTVATDHIWATFGMLPWASQLYCVFCNFLSRRQWLAWLDLRMLLENYKHFQNIWYSCSYEKENKKKKQRKTKPNSLAFDVCSIVIHCYLRQNWCPEPAVFHRWVVLFLVQNPCFLPFL